MHPYTREEIDSMLVIHKQTISAEIQGMQSVINNQIQGLATREDTQEIMTQLKSLDPIVEAYDGAVFGKKILFGTASVLGALAVIGGSVLWFFNQLKPH